MPAQPQDRSARSPSSRRRRARQFILGLVVIGVITPLQFFLRFGQVPAPGWGLTVFLLLLAVLVEVGTLYSIRAEYHTPVLALGGWLDRLGAFWLVACAFTPVLGWLLTSAFTLTAENWRLLYGLRAGLCFGLPLITALPLIDYLKGKSARLGGPILITVTLVAMLAGWWCFRDLIDGPRPGRLEVISARSCRVAEPVVSTVRCQREWGPAPGMLPILYLGHTNRVMLLIENGEMPFSINN